MKTVSLYDDKSKRFLVYKEFHQGILTPVKAFEALASITPLAAILESGQAQSDEPYYSYIGVGECRHYVTDTNLDIDPFDQLRAESDRRTIFHAPVNVPLAGSRLGFIPYDAVRHSLRLPENDSSAIHLLEHEMALTFDHHQSKVYLSVVAEEKKEAIASLEEVYQLLMTRGAPFSIDDESFLESLPVEVDTSDEEFADMVGQAKEYLLSGDAFQIVLSRKFKTSVQASPFAIYCSIREHCRSPYKFFIQTESFSVCGASPERLVKIDNGIIENMPIAGTRPCTHTDEDASLEQELINDEKEHAEHMMLVDLARNDIGRVAKPGSVTVVELKKVYRYSHVMHLVSRVQGQLKEGISPIEALKASFPAGTLSGAPKIRAMQIIDTIEQSPRGLYGGAICLIDHSQNIDSFIAIRMAVIKDGIATVQAGAGIVMDSDPQMEAEETYHKAKAILHAIEMAQEVVA
jgi:anthranilate synthase component I